MKLRIIASLLLLGLSSSAIAASGTSLSKDGFLMLEVASQVKLKSANESLKMANEVLVNFYNSEKTIQSIDDPILREWTTTVARLYASEKVLAAQILMKEISSNNKSPAYTIFKTVTSDATQSDSHDPASANVEKIYQDHTKRYTSLNKRAKECAGIIVKAAIYGDDVASKYGQVCLNSEAPEMVSSAMSDASAAKRKADKLR